MASAVLQLLQARFARADEEFDPCLALENPVTMVARLQPQGAWSMAEPWNEAIRENDFSAEASVRGRMMEVSLSGTADIAVKGNLDRLVHSLHSEAQRLALIGVNVDVRRLEFMDSSCLKSLAWWIGTVHELPAEGRYRIVFLSSPTVYWQRRSLNALAGLAGDVMSVQA